MRLADDVLRCGVAGFEVAMDCDAVDIRDGDGDGERDEKGDDLNLLGVVWRRGGGDVDGGVGGVTLEDWLFCSLQIKRVYIVHNSEYQFFPT